MPTREAARFWPALVPLIVLTLPLMPSKLQAVAATIRVSTTVDDILINGNCTLREAVIAANTDTAVDRCPAGSGTDTIALPAGTYVLSRIGPNEDAAWTGDLDITQDVNLFGAGADATIIDGGAFDAQTQDRVFHVLSGALLGLFDVTIQGGVCQAGGGIFNAGILMISGSLITNNVASESSPCGPSGAGAAGIFNRGRLVMYRSSLLANRVHGYLIYDVEAPGGGLINSGSALIRYSTISGNYGAGGGGISNGGELEVNDSQITGNGARFWGAGLENVGGTATLTRTTVSSNSDGGIVNGSWRGTPATLVLRNSTVTGNQSFRVPGGIFNFAGPIEITHSTIAGNFPSQFGAGIGGATGSVRLANSIMANGTLGDCAGPIVSLGHNLGIDASCGLTAPGDLPNTDPLLGPLADNGGPTPTRALRPGSPAIGQIGAAGCLVETDQRGVARLEQLNGATCDIGAYEFSPAGDIRLIVKDIRGLLLAHALTREQETSLVARLKPAAIAVMGDDAPGACQALDGFRGAVSDYVGSGGLAQEDGQTLTDGAGRVMGIICP